MENNSQQKFILQELNENEKDIELFCSYLEHQGIDINQDNIPLSDEEIKKLINAFKNQEIEKTQKILQDSIFLNNQTEELDQLNSSNEIDTENNDDLKTRISSLYENKNTQDIQVHELEIENQMQITDLFKEINIKCEIHSFSIKKKRVFFRDSKQVKYKIITNPLKWETLRTYKDFLALQNSLIKTFPLNFVLQKDSIT